MIKSQTQSSNQQQSQTESPFEHAAGQRVFCLASPRTHSEPRPHPYGFAARGGARLADTCLTAQSDSLSLLLM